MAINRDKVLEAAQKYVEKKKYDKAVAELRKLVEADPNDARTLLKIGDLQAKQNLYADAINTYESVGKLYATQGFALKAIAVYKQIREIIAKHVPQLEERYGHIAPKLAELYQQLGLTSDALAALDEVATRLQRQQKDQEAIDVFRKIVELDPTNPLPHLRLAEALSRVKDVEGAVAEFKTAAQQLTGIGRRDDAIKVLERLLHHKQDAEQARLCAELYLSRAQPQDGMQALAKLQVCFQANPRDFETLSLLARAFNAIGQGAKAIEVQKEMARVARDTGKMDLFREILERLNRVAPHDEGVRRLGQTSGSVQAPPPYGAAAVQPEPPPPEPAPMPAPRFQPPPLQQQPQVPPPQFGGPPPLRAGAGGYTPPVPVPPAPSPPQWNPPAAAIPYVPPGPAPMPPQPHRGTQPVPRGHTEAYPAHGHQQQPQQDYGYEDDVEEVVDDAEVVDDEAAGYEDPNQGYGNGYGEQDHITGRGAAPGYGQASYEDANGYEDGQAGYLEQDPDYITADGNANAGHGVASYEEPDDMAPASGAIDTAEVVNKALADAGSFRRVRLYAKALEVLRSGLDVEPRSMDLHEVYRDVLIESEQTEDAVEEMLVIAGLYVDALDGESAARALQDVLAFDPHNQRAIDMLQELGYEIVDENEGQSLEEPQDELLDNAQSIDGSDPYAEDGQHPHERLPSYDLEEMGAADVASHYADEQRQVHVRRGASQAPAGYGEEDAIGSEALPSFPLDEPEVLEPYEEEPEEEIPSVRPMNLQGRRPGPPPLGPLPPLTHIAHPESAPELRVSQPPAFGRISMVPRSMSKPPPSLGASGRELEDALDEAEFFCSRGLYDDARAILSEQLGKHPNHPLLQERLQEIESQESQRGGSGAREKPRGGEQDRAFDIAQSLDALESLDYANIEPAEGHAGEEQQVDVEEVFAKFKEGVAKQISVDDSDSHYNLGIAYKEMMLVDDAIREFEVASRDPKRECVCRSMIGMIEIERGNLNEAIEAFLQGLNAQHKDPQQETVLCYEIGAAYEAKKLGKEALSYYQKAMRRDPNYRDVQERVRRLSKSEPKPAMRAAVGADDEFDRAFDDLLGKS